jgi:hypothetical protein
MEIITLLGAHKDLTVPRVHLIVRGARNFFEHFVLTLSYHILALSSFFADWLCFESGKGLALLRIWQDGKRQGNHCGGETRQH